MVEADQISDNFVESFNTLYDKQREEFQKITEGKEELLVRDLTSYIRMQFNAATVKSYLNEQQYAEVVTRAIDGLQTLLYLKHYPKEMELAMRDTLFASASNFIYLISNRILYGRDTENGIRELAARQPVLYPGVK